LSGRQAAGVAGGAVGPPPQRWAAQASSLDEDHKFHGQPGDVHRRHVRPVQGTADGSGPDTHQGDVLYDAAEHVAAEHQCQAAEDLPFDYRAAGREHRPDPLGQVLVMGHRYLR
jgi:hypothetical protein